jgi:hypothetical protein
MIKWLIKSITWLIKRNGACEQQCGEFSELKSAVAEEVGSKSYNEIFCDYAKGNYVLEKVSNICIIVSNLPSETTVCLQTVYCNQ